MPTYADTYSATYLDTYGVPSVAPAVFPLAPLDLRCELQLASTWTDVSSYVYQREGTSPPVTITRGRPDETQQASPSSAAWQWNNRSGLFSPKNPLSPFYGLLGRNTGVRFSVPSVSNYLRLETDASSCAVAADNAAMHVTGSLDVRLSLRLTDWRGCFLAGRVDTTSTGAWRWDLRSDGTMRFSWWDSGNVEHVAVSDAPLPYVSGDFALKVTLDATSGTVTWSAAASIGGTYTQLGDAVIVTGTATSVRAGSDPLRVGWTPVTLSDVGSGSAVQMYGRAYEVQLRNGIGGTIVADGQFSAQAAGTTSWTGTDGLSWITSGGAEISSRDYRYHGLMSSQPPKWDATGRDQYVNAKAGGPLRILGQGSKPPVQSPISRAISLQSGSAQPIIYWPLEDASGSSFFGAAIGGNPMTWVGATPALAADSSFIASAPLPTLNGAALRGFVPSYAGGTAWSVTFLANIQVPASNQVFFQVDCAGDALAAYIVLVVDSDGTVAITAVDGSLNTIADTGPVSVLAGLPAGIQQPLLWTMQATQSGSHVQYTLAAVAPGATTGFAASATSTANGIPGHVTFVTPGTYVGEWTGSVVGHVQVQATAPSVFALGSPLNAWIGETAATRFARLCGENGWPVRIKGSPAASALMGPQGISTFQTLLQECETADRGQLGEAREVAGFSYRTLASMLNQSPVLTLSYTSSQPGGVSGSPDDNGLDPSYDDLLVRNDWTVTRGASTGSQGATVRAELNDGSEMSVTQLTDYADSLTVNVEADSQLADVANWMVHVGTVDEHRWPVVPLNLARSQMASLQGAAMTVDVGDLVEIDSIPTVVLYDPVRQLALGFTEALGGKWWTMQYQEVPASPYATIVLDDPVLGRLDTDGSDVHATAAYPQSSLSADTTSGFPLWTTTAGDFPFDIACSGMRLTATNASGSSSPQTLTTTPAVNGVQKSLTAGSDVRLWTPPVLALT